MDNAKRNIRHHPFSIVNRTQKNTLCLYTRDKVRNTLCGTTLGCRGLADTTAHCPPSRADALTGINRPHLLASSFSRKLQGDFHPPHPSALHQTAALFAGTKGVLVLIHAKMFNYWIIISRFCRLSMGNVPTCLGNRCRTKVVCPRRNGGGSPECRPGQGAFHAGRDHAPLSSARRAALSAH